MLNAFFIIVAGFFGLMIGSFLNVVIYRLPIMMQRAYENYIAQEKGQTLPYNGSYNLVVPRSACVHCQHSLSIAENIPLLSYLIQRGRCVHCAATISMRYPIIECLTAAFSVILIACFGNTLLGWSSCLFVYFLIVMTMIDIDTQLLPDTLTLPLLWCGLLLNISGTFVPLSDAVMGAVAGYLSLWAVYWIFKMITGKQGLGYGDFKFLAALGAWLGWQMISWVILLSSVMGVLIGGTWIFFCKHDRGKPMAFGPYLAVAGVLALFFGNAWLSDWR